MCMFPMRSRSIVCRDVSRDLVDRVNSDWLASIRAQCGMWDGVFVDLLEAAAWSSASSACSGGLAKMEADQDTASSFQTQDPKLGHRIA
jgi:hypothetical protein